MFACSERCEKSHCSAEEESLDGGDTSGGDTGGVSTGVGVTLVVVCTCGLDEDDHGLNRFALQPETINKIPQERRNTGRACIRGFPP